MVDAADLKIWIKIYWDARGFKFVSLLLITVVFAISLHLFFFRCKRDFIHTCIGLIHSKTRRSMHLYILHVCVIPHFSNVYACILAHEYPRVKYYV